MIKSATNAKMKRNSGFMVYLKNLKEANQFRYILHICFDGLSGTELRVCLNVIFAGNPILFNSATSHPALDHRGALHTQ